jgi:hypothetical protein
MFKCNVCFDEIKTNEYIETIANETDENECIDCVDTNDTTCLRLKCGHAFHTNCIISSFRRNEKCPMCRKELVNKLSEDYILFTNETLEETPNNDFEWILLDTLVKQDRCRNSDLKSLRNHLNLSIKDFHIYHTSLKQKRRETIKKALKEFRIKHNKEFRKKFKKVQTNLNIVKIAEKTNIEKLAPNMETPFTETILKEYFKFNHMYDAASILTKNDIDMNGFSRRFWN